MGGGTFVVYWGNIGIVEKKNGNYRDSRCLFGIVRIYIADIIGIVVKKMEATI